MLQYTPRNRGIIMTSDKDTLAIRKQIYGFRREDKTVLRLDSVQRSIDLLNQIEFPQKEVLSTPALNLKRITRVAQKDFSNLFPNLNRKVLYLPKKEIETLAIQHLKNKSKEIDIIRDFNTRAQNVDMLNIPLNLIQKEERTGSALLCAPVPEDRSLINMIKNIPSQIDITGPSDYLTAIIYEHELVHLLLRRHKGSIEDYYHDEVLPMFLEKVFALKNDQTENLLATMETFRIRGHQLEHKLIKTNKEIFDERAHQHLISGLIANLMFSRYYNETPIGRRNMLDEIEKVLNGEKTTEEMLKDQSIEISSSELVTATEHSVSKCLIK